MAVQVADLHLLRDQLLLRRQKLETATARAQTANLVLLLEQVDKALEKMDAGSYGICEVCHDHMGAQRLLSDPLARMCIDCLPPEHRRALEQDLELAARIQSGLLPKQDFCAAGWNVAYHYEPAGMVSGDYCDVVAHGKDFYFMVGDVSGKGVAASMLMANLHAMFRVLVPTGLPLAQLVERANRIFCESTLPTQYATLICAKADDFGNVEICNGGHPAPLHVKTDGITAIKSSTVPLGLFCEQQFQSIRIRLQPGDSLVVYTDGLTESLGPDGSEYGEDRLTKLLSARNGHNCRQLLDLCVQDVQAFGSGTPKLDDQTLMVLKFSAA